TNLQSRSVWRVSRLPVGVPSPVRHRPRAPDHRKHHETGPSWSGPEQPTTAELSQKSVRSWSLPCTIGRSRAVPFYATPRSGPGTVGVVAPSTHAGRLAVGKPL